jgi:hypothetical protein
MSVKNTDMRILNGRTKSDSLGRRTFHGTNGISVIDYIICDQELFQNTKYFVVKLPTYLSDHSQITTWIDIGLHTNDLSDINQCQLPMSELPLQFIWYENSKSIFRPTLKSPETQQKLYEFTNSDFTNDLNGINKFI